ncbi:MAG: SDR family NAD(P)-dependent oxidoreductase [Thermodesulfobacteriota bacterium]
MALKDKKIIVTGGVKGIGNCLVRNLIKEGAIVGVFDINTKGLEDMQKEDSNLFCLRCDITDHEQVEAAVNKFFNKFGAIDILVNNAGVLFSAPLVSLSIGEIKKHDYDAWNKIISTNLSSAFYMAVNVAEKMILKRTKGVIVNISSVSAAGNPGQSAYSAAKAGVNALTTTWAKELGPLGIRVVGIAPGYTDTESTRAVLNEDVLKDIVKRVPLRRLGNVNDIVGAIRFVMENNFANGKIFEVDGGLVV